MKPIEPGSIYQYEIRTVRCAHGTNSFHSNQCQIMKNRKLSHKLSSIELVNIHVNTCIHSVYCGWDFINLIEHRA